MTPQPHLLPKEKPRLEAQCRRIMAFYVQHPGSWFTLGEITRGIGGASEAGVSARLRQLTGDPYHWGKARRKRSRNLWEYRLTPPGEPAQLGLL